MEAQSSLQCFGVHPMNPLNFESSPIIESRWFGRIALLAAALLISPTFSFGMLATTWRKAGVFALMSALYAIAFYVVYNRHVDPANTASDVTTLTDTLVLWTTVVGSAAPFAAGAILRYGWEARDVRIGVVTACVSFGVLTYGWSLMSDRLDDLTAETSVSEGKAIAYDSLIQIVNAEIGSRADTPEIWMARYLTTRLNDEINGIEGPKSLQEFRDGIVRRRTQKALESAAPAVPPAN